MHKDLRVRWGYNWSGAIPAKVSDALYNGHVLRKLAQAHGVLSGQGRKGRID